ncbi:MAG: S8 family peptidase [Dysgonamonadaceae bacterium]|jgi:hypothetical protein|nr:S8 family peptidase [Dysgonamonadaceae bacterium]
MKILPILVLLFCTGISAAQKTVMYRLILTDKGISPYSIDRPEEFLSPKSIDRRIRQGFPVDETDLPISPTYFDAVIETGASIRTYSKWVKTIVVDVSNEETVELLRELPFVSRLYPVWEGVITQAPFPFFTSGFYSELYGSSFTQISLQNGHLLHEQGYYGKNISIAVMDGGFLDADNITCFDPSKILGVKNFTHENENPLRSIMDHGTKVLSCMLANQPQEMMGTAPEAEYYLFKTEVNGSEFPVEEDYWVAGVEYADSLGVDIVSTSLGYFTFPTKPEWDHTQSELDGQTVPASRAASMAAYKGMILCNSAGNEQRNVWGKIAFPSDADNILTVGAVASDSTLASFSSVGYSSDGRVKPDIVAMGVNTTVWGPTGKRTDGNGTSFSCPIISGSVASLWQALPKLNSLELMDLIRKSANRYQNPDNEYGYGIPDFFKAYNEGKKEVSIPRSPLPGELVASPEGNRLYIRNNDSPNARISIYTTMGTKAMETPATSAYIDTSNLRKGIYIACMQKEDKRYICKFIKQ